MNKYFENAHKLPVKDIEIGKLYRFTRPYVIDNCLTKKEKHWPSFIEDVSQIDSLNNFTCLEFDFINKIGGKRIKILFLGEFYSMFVGDGIPPICEEIK